MTPAELVSEPRTEAGRALHGGHCRYPATCDYLAAILAIETQAVALLDTLPAAPTIDSADDERLAAAQAAVAAVLPKGWQSYTRACGPRAVAIGNPAWQAQAYRDQVGVNGWGDTEIAALDALADALLHRGETGTLLARDQGDT